MTHISRIDIDRILIELLARGCSQSEAARVAKCSRRTVFRRLADPSFKLKVNEFQARILEAAAAKLVAVVAEDTDKLMNLLSKASPKRGLNCKRKVRKLGKMVALLPERLR